MEPKKPGRPRLNSNSTEPSAEVHLRLANSMYDQADQLRRKNRESIQDLLRRGLQRLLLDERGGSI